MLYFSFVIPHSQLNVSTLNLHDSGADNFLATKWWWILASINEISPGGYAVDLILNFGFL
jgi:hypothetical protein